MYSYARSTYNGSPEVLHRTPRAQVVTTTMYSHFNNLMVLASIRKRKMALLTVEVKGEEGRGKHLTLCEYISARGKDRSNRTEIRSSPLFYCPTYRETSESDLCIVRNFADIIFMKCKCLFFYYILSYISIIL